MNTIKIKSIPATLAPYIGINASIAGVVLSIIIQMIDHFSLGATLGGLFFILTIPFTYFSKLVETQTLIEIYEDKLIMKRPVFYRKGKFFFQEEVIVLFIDIQELSISWRLQSIIINKNASKLILPLCVKILDGELPETHVKVDNKYKNGAKYMEFISKKSHVHLGGALH